MQRAATPARAAALLLGLLVLFYFLSDAAHLAWQVPQSPNEGWNAYHARAAMTGGPLYPAPPSFFYNNYPPLSFYVAGVLGRLLGDFILAGRLISLLAAPGIAVCLYAAARRMGADAGSAALAGLIFLASPWVLSRMTGVDDPQLLGDLLDAAALAVIARNPGGAGAILLTALLLTMAVFVKPLFIALPLALLVWLWLRRPRDALLLAACCIGFGLLGLGAARLFLGVDLLQPLLAPRIFLVSKMLGQPGQWLIVEAVPLAAALALLRERRDPFCLLAALYAGIAFLLSIYFSGGDGVSASQMIDAAMAAALGAGLYLSRATPPRGWLTAGLLLLAAALVLAYFGRFAGGIVTPAELARQRPIARADIAAIAARPEPVFCETSALCYWAGKTAQVDGFGLSQAFKTGARRENDLTRVIAARHYSLIQVAPRSPFAYSPGIAAAIAAQYRLDHTDVLGRFWVPAGR